MAKCILSCVFRAGDFVEDDDGMGYVDVGEEDYWGAEDGAVGSGDEEYETEPDAKRQKTGKQDKGESIYQDDSYEVVLNGPESPHALKGQHSERLLCHAGQSKKKAPKASKAAKQSINRLFTAAAGARLLTWQRCCSTIDAMPVAFAECIDAGLLSKALMPGFWRTIQGRGACPAAKVLMKLCSLQSSQPW